MPEKLENIKTSSSKTKETLECRNTSTKEPEIIIPAVLQELLLPLGGQTKVGQDAVNTEAYFKLEMEIGKIKPDYSLCIEWGKDILQNHGKDLRVAVWISFAWYRSHGIEGLRNGLQLILELMKQFGESLYPQNATHRGKSLLFLNTSRVLKLIEREDPKQIQTQHWLDIGEIISDLEKECSIQFPKQTPDITEISKVLTKQIDIARDLFKKSSPVIHPEKNSEKEIIPPKETEDKSIRIPSPAVMPTSEIQQTPILSEKEVVVTLKHVIQSYFEDMSSGNKQRKIPQNTFIYGVSRALIWGNLVQPPHKDFITQIESPNATMRNNIVEWVATKDWEKLVPIVEINFLKEDSGFQYWFDAHYCLVQGFQDMGGKYTHCADDVKFHLSRLLMKYPDLPRMIYKDKQTPFASSETIHWLNNDVKDIISGGKTRMTLLPPIMGEDYKPIDQEYQKACEEPLDNFQNNLEKMQKAIAGEIRRKGRFLRSLNLGNYCIHADHYDLAKVIFNQLLHQIETYQIAEWEPALCVSVWQSMYLVNSHFLKTETDPDLIREMEKQQKDLFSKIANYDGVLALKLTNRNLKEGD